MTDQSENVNARGLLAWQWQGYARYHQSRANLMMHIVLVPLFLAGNVGFVVGVIRQRWLRELRRSQAARHQ